MKDSARKSRQVPLMTTRGRPTALISGRPAALPKTIYFAALGPIHECLADIAVDHKLAALGNLRNLVLRVAMNVDLQAIHAAGGIIAVGSIQINANIVRVGSQTGAMESLPAQAIDDETLPARLVGFAEKHGIAIIPFGRKALRIDNQHFFSGSRSLPGARE